MKKKSLQSLNDLAKNQMIDRALLTTIKGGDTIDPEPEITRETTYSINMTLDFYFDTGIE